MMLHVTGRGFIAQQPNTGDGNGGRGFRRARNGVTNPIGIGQLGMTVEEARQLLATGNGTPEQLHAANVLYYGAPATTNSPATVGYYNQLPDTIAAQSGGNGGGGGIIPQPAYPGNTEPVPNLYAMENCDAMDGACIGRNQQREIANQTITNNARNQYNRDMCEYDFALNVNRTGNTAYPYMCQQYATMTVPPAPGTPTTPVSGGGQVLAAVVGQTPATPVSGNTPVYAPHVDPTVTQVPNNNTQATTVTGKPNQTVPPNPSPGTVAVPATPTAAQTLATSSVNGTAPVVDNVTAGDPFGLGITGTLFGFPEWQVLLAGAAVGIFLLGRKS